RDPQLTVHADQTVRSASGIPSTATASGAWPGMPRSDTVDTRAAAPPVIADHLRKVRLLGPDRVVAGPASVVWLTSSPSPCAARGGYQTRCRFPTAGLSSTSSTHPRC